MASSKVASMRDAVAELVRDGDTVAIEGFTHLIGFAAGHEIIRQRKRDLTLARLTPDVIYDQMIAGGVASKLVFSWLGNPGVGGLGAIRRRIEGDIPDQPLAVEEYSHFGMVGRYTAGAMNLPFFPLRSYFETDLPVANPLIRPIASPYGDETIYAVPPLKPDVAIVHAQRATAARRHPGLGAARLPEGGGLRGGSGDRRGRGGRRRRGVRADPNRTIIPGLIVDAVVVEPWGAHPVVRPGRVRPRQPVLPRLGPDHPRRGRGPGLAARVGLRPRRARGLPREARRRAGRLAAAVGAGAVRLRGLRDLPVSGSLMILVAGPYRSGTDGDPARIAANVEAMTAVSLELWRRGHLPVMGEWFALPLIEQAQLEGDPPRPGRRRSSIRSPSSSWRAATRACASAARRGADRMVATARRLGKTVYTSLEDVP